MRRSEALSSQEPDTGERVRVLLSSVPPLWPRAVEPEQTTKPAPEVPARLKVIPGKLQCFGPHAGKPSSYFIGEDSGYPDYHFVEGSLLYMARAVLGEDALLLRLDPSNTPEELAGRAEVLKARLEDPETQKMIRTAYEQKVALRKRLLDY